MNTPLLDIAAHLEIDSPAGKIQVSGSTSFLTFSFGQWSALYAAYKQLKRLRRSGIDLVNPNRFNQFQGKIVLNEREVATFRLHEGGLTRLLGVRLIALRPLNFLSALMRP